MASTISAGITTTTALSYSADTSGVLQLQTNGGTTAVTIDTNQNVGIGVTPDSIGSNWKALELANGIYLASYTGSTNADMYLGCNNYWNGTAYIGKVSGYNATQYEQYQGQHRWWNTNGSNVTGGSSFTFTQAMTLDASGRLLVGQTSYTQANYPIGITGLGGIWAISTGTGDASYASHTTSNTYHYYAETSSRVFSVAQSGAIASTNTSITAISDQRLKENIKPLETGLAQVLALQPRRFDWNSEAPIQGKNIAGFIAQEVQEILPDLVEDWHYKIGSEETLLSLKMGDMLPTLVKAIQEQQAMITTLQSQVTTLQTQVTALQSKG